MITQNAIPFVQFYRKQHPTTPIVFVEGTAIGKYGRVQILLLLL